MKDVIEQVVPIPVLLTLPNPRRLKAVEEDKCWKRVGCWKEVSAQSALHALVPVHYFLVKAIWQCRLLSQEGALKLRFTGQ